MFNAGPRKPGQTIFRSTCPDCGEFELNFKHRLDGKVDLQDIRLIYVGNKAVEYGIQCQKCNQQILKPAIGIEEHADGLMEAGVQKVDMPTSGSQEELEAFAQPLLSIDDLYDLRLDLALVTADEISRLGVAK